MFIGFRHHRIRQHHQDGASRKGLHECNPACGDVTEKNEASSGRDFVHTKAMMHHSRPAAAGTACFHADRPRDRPPAISERKIAANMATLYRLAFQHPAPPRSIRESHPGSWPTPSGPPAWSAPRHPATRYFRDQTLRSRHRCKPVAPGKAAARENQSIESAARRQTNS